MNTTDVQLARLTEALFAARRARGFSLDDVAYATVMGPGYLAAAERGDKELTLLSMLAYGRVIGLDLAISKTPDGPDLARRRRNAFGDGPDEQRIRELAWALRLCRIGLDLSQADVAASALVSQPFVAQIETDRARPGTRALLRLVGAVSCTIDWRVSASYQDL